MRRRSSDRKLRWISRKSTVNSAADRLASNNASLKAELERLKSGGGSQEAFDRLKQTGEQLIRTIAECQDVSNQSNADNERVQAEIVSAKNEINEI